MKKIFGIIFAMMLLCTGCSNVLSQGASAEETTDVESSAHEKETTDEAKGSAFTGALLEQLDIEQDDLLLERYQQQNADMEKIVGISEIYSGSFTGTEKEEMLVLFRRHSTYTR